ncbi:hypothetical protein FACS1894172_05890 [Spirochaetia bacterium]|nr:hypothetical protein FACS1894164_15350 [Spirochaetia bacterium]GHU31263.1 hypothetical protein FACS1894172_05890 [Spirochaetia bacterium]
MIFLDTNSIIRYLTLDVEEQAKEHNPVEEDVQEFAESAIKSGASAGLTVAATGGITVAIKRC